MRPYFTQKDAVLAENYSIGLEPRVITSPSTLVVDHDKQFISLVLRAAGYEPEYKRGIRTPDGGIIHVKVTLLDENGTRFPLEFT